VKHVIVVGPGAADKSTLAVRLGEITGLPVIELDKFFWRPGLQSASRRISRMRIRRRRKESMKTGGLQRYIPRETLTSLITCAIARTWPTK